ncbi:MAG: hypothetical protein CMI66_07975 [Pedosphaera sp.]|nr:hypothetical protein [Pedosphaera sp.]HCP37950.1 hypothetical protein [Verrucomicrobiales bacterium]
MKILFIKRTPCKLPLMPLSRLICICLLWATVGCQTSKQESFTVTREITSFMQRYVRLANEGNATDVAREIYAMPVLGKGFNNTNHKVTTDPDIFEEDFSAFLKQLKGEGFDRFHIWGLDIRPSGKDMAVVDMDFQWRHSDGTSIGPEHRIATYILIRKPHGWRIVSANGQSFE